MSAPTSLKYPAVPLPPNLRQDLPDPTIPWKISDRIISEMKGQAGVKFKKVEVLPTDPEWRFIWRHFHHDKPNQYDMSRVYCLHERHQVQAFELNLSAQEREADKFTPSWNEEPRAQQRATTIERWRGATDPFSPFQTMETDGRRRTWEKTKVLPLWHGSSSEVCESVGESGFTFFGKRSLGSKGASDPKSTDDGFFGSGIYFTSSARYAADIYSLGHLLLSWVSMREPFPVVGDSAQQDMATLRGQGAYKHYNAHYVPVHPETKTQSCALYYPCKPGEAAYCDELVVFQKSQAVPRFWVVLQPSILHLVQPGHEEPECVEDLMPHLLALLQHSAIEKDKKARNALNGALAQLMQLPGDDYLDDHGFEGLYAKLQQLITGGKVNRAVAKMLSSSSIAAPEAPSSAQASHSQASEPKPAQHKMASPKVSYATGSYETDLVKALEASVKTAPQASSPKTSAPPKATASSAQHIQPAAPQPLLHSTSSQQRHSFQRLPLERRSGRSTLEMWVWNHLSQQTSTRSCQHNVPSGQTSV